MFWRRKKGPSGPPQVGCFGKLPATGDFIRLNASTDELAAFDRLLSLSDHVLWELLSGRSEPADAALVPVLVALRKGPDEQPDKADKEARKR